MEPKVRSRKLFVLSQTRGKSRVLGTTGTKRIKIGVVHEVRVRDPETPRDLMSDDQDPKTPGDGSHYWVVPTGVGGLCVTGVSFIDNVPSQCKARGPDVRCCGTLYECRSSFNCLFFVSVTGSCRGALTSGNLCHSGVSLVRLNH